MLAFATNFAADEIVGVSSVPSFSHKVLITSSIVSLMNTNEKDSVENSWAASKLNFFFFFFFFFLISRCLRRCKAGDSIQEFRLSF
jgi:hypothetical protein